MQGVTLLGRVRGKSPQGHRLGVRYVSDLRWDA